MVGTLVGGQANARSVEMKCRSSETNPNATLPLLKNMTATDAPSARRGSVGYHKPSFQPIISRTSDTFDFATSTLSAAHMMTTTNSCRLSPRSRLCSGATEVHPPLRPPATSASLVTTLVKLPDCMRAAMTAFHRDNGTPTGSNVISTVLNQSAAIRPPSFCACV